MPFMVVLKNITKTKDSISANYYPEGDMNKEGFMKMSIPDKKIIEHKKAVECSTAPVHAMYELRRMADRENPPKEITVLWY